MALFVLNHFSAFYLPEGKNEKKCSVQSIPDVNKVPRTTFFYWKYFHLNAHFSQVLLLHPKIWLRSS